MPRPVRHVLRERQGDVTEGTGRHGGDGRQRVLRATNKYILGRLKEDRILKNTVAEAINAAEEVDIG
jgi:hypothetical protein